MEFFLFLVLAVIAFVFFFFLRKRRNNSGFRVFMYHHVGKQGDGNSHTFLVNNEMLEKHFDLLKEKGFHPVALSEVENAYINKTALPEKSVLLTFDDGYLNNYQYAYPLAVEKKVPITIFLSTGEIGKKDDMMTWEQVIEMDKSGYVEFSSHGVNHKRLRALSNEEVLSELRESKNTLETLLEKPVRSFCYPYGAFDKRVRKLVLDSGYLMDYGTRKGINSWPWKGKRPLVRAHVMSDETIEDFDSQLKTGHKKCGWKK